MFVKHIGDDTYAAVLEINNVTEEDAGRYKVVAKNEFGETTAGNEVSFDNE